MIPALRSSRFEHCPVSHHRADYGDVIPIDGIESPSACNTSPKTPGHAALIGKTGSSMWSSITLLWCSKTDFTTEVGS